MNFFLLFQGVTNFVLYKFGHLAQRDWQTMYDLAKMFLHCLNHWKLETPTSRQTHSGTDDIATYKVNYTRYINIYPAVTKNDMPLPPI